MIDKVLNSIQDYIQKSELAIFCGAGISFNSGIPLVFDIKKRILQELGLKNDEISNVLDFPMPFESFMESLINLHKTELLFDIFESTQPNANHYLIAYLAKLGFLKTIITTNFDTLIERALELFQVSFTKYYHEDEFQNIPQNSNSIILVKLHGCISDKKNMGITIRKVSEQKLVSQRMQALKYLFNNNSNKALLILGYSCSDIFDISPNIINNEFKKLEIFFIDHNYAKSPVILPISQKTGKNPFKEYNGYNIQINTDWFINQLSLIFGFKNDVNITTNNDWQYCISNWSVEIINKNTSNFINYAAGTLLFNIDNYIRAIPYFTKFYNSSIEKTHIAEGAFALGKTYREIGDELDKSKHFLKIAIKISKEFGLYKMQSKALNSLGIVYWDTKEFEKSIECYDEAFSISESASNIEIQAKCIGNKAIVLKDMGGDENLRKSLKSHEQSLHLSQSIGDKKSEGRTLGNIGRTYSAMGDKIKAIEFYQKALNIAIDLSDLRHMGIWHENIGAEYVNIENDLAGINLNKAIEIFSSINNSSYVERCRTYLEKIKKDN